MLFRIFFIVSHLITIFAVQLNFYTSVGQVRQEISIKDGYIQIHFTDQEYNAIIPGTIDFPGQQIIEQDLYNSNEELRNTDIFIRFDKCENNHTLKAKLIDPYSLLIKYDSLRYAYVSRAQIEFDKDPLLDGMILSVRLDNESIETTNMTYLTRGLWWTPRYEVMVIDDRSATLRALADLNNEHQRLYDTTRSQLVTGSIPLASNSVRAPAPMEAQRVELMAGSMSDASLSISSIPDSTNFGSYSYNITHKFSLLPKSIKTFPFLSAMISFNYTLETSVYLSTGAASGFFQRIFIIKPSEFLPAGTITFYLATTGITLGQGRLTDTPKQSEQKISVGNDPDVRFNIISVITAINQTPTYGQDLDVNVTVSNRKDKQTVSVKLTINSGFRNTTLLIKNLSSSNIRINQSSNDKSILIIQATIQPNQNERCNFSLKQLS
ncbi:unnamed protein product [Rotaria magnacalcarata]|uniref:Uncharacterized protein n=3 Tax=Rotaria magnacalcarata TaxID=392030 RepID=A0A816VV83_9BILA|nr:unnamed protein product [Rotaria magnacalcarata]CAF2125465.1 unnamed protein product [Rotaria magnacalcarata]CAF3753827.1 unnamed protein product [Rotaria magnacalcarata]CAF3940383.1 unnamed protein product [Rotaria magnacalcarata]